MARFFRSFLFAVRGIGLAFLRETNCRIQVGIAALVIAGGLWLGLTEVEWLTVILCCGLVISLEMINTAVERLCNRITRERDDQIRHIKDVAAGAVLWASIVAAVIGLFIFLPKLLALWHGH